LILSCHEGCDSILYAETFKTGIIVFDLDFYWSRHIMFDVILTDSFQDKSRFIDNIYQWYQSNMYKLLIKH